MFTSSCPTCVKILLISLHLPRPTAWPTEPSLQSSLELKLKETEEACRVQEQRRVDLELRLVDVKENLKKVEAGPFTLGTAVDSGLLDMVTVSRRMVHLHAQPEPPSGSECIWFVFSGEGDGTGHSACDGFCKRRRRANQLCLHPEEQAPVSHCVEQGECPAEGQGQRSLGVLQDNIAACHCSASL